MPRPHVLSNLEILRVVSEMTSPPAMVLELAGRLATALEEINVLAIDIRRLSAP